MSTDEPSPTTPRMHPAYPQGLETVPIRRAIVRRLLEKLGERGIPHLFAPRNDDWHLSPLPAANGAYWLQIDPRTCPSGIVAVAQMIAERHEPEDSRGDRCFGTLLGWTALLFTSGPRRFIEEGSGRDLGRLEICDNAARVSGPLALSCLSYYLRHNRGNLQVAWLYTGTEDAHG